MAFWCGNEWGIETRTCWMDGNHQDLKIVVHTFSILFGCYNGVEAIEADRKKYVWNHWI
jgi:hypothetical protein